MGGIGFGLIFVFRNVPAFVFAICVIMPFGGALFSQSFSFARAFHNVKDPARAEFMTSILRTIFAVAWAVVPPFVGWIAATTTVFNVYGIASAAYFAVAAIYAILLRNPEAKIGTPPAKSGEAGTRPRAQIDLPVAIGIAGVILIFIAIQLNNVAVPLLITSTLSGTFGELGIFAGLAAALELPFMIAWGYALRWIPKHTIIIAAALLYALYLALLGRAGSVTEILWLQLINGPATAALMSIPISYLQDAIRNRVGLSTSLLDVVTVTSVLSSAALFGALTANSPDYPLLFFVAAGSAVAGAAILFAAHWLLPKPRAEPAGN